MSVRSTHLAGVEGLDNSPKLGRSCPVICYRTTPFLSKHAVSRTSSFLYLTTGQEKETAVGRSSTLV